MEILEESLAQLSDEKSAILRRFRETGRNRLHWRDREVLQVRFSEINAEIEQLRTKIEKGK